MNAAPTFREADYAAQYPGAGGYTVFGDWDDTPETTGPSAGPAELDAQRGLDAAIEQRNFWGSDTDA